MYFKWLLAFILGVFVSHAAAVPRDVQIKTVNFGAHTIELYNFGGNAESLDNWVICTHNKISRACTDYTVVSGLNLAPAESLIIHFQDDIASLGHLNISSLGGNYLPLERGSFALSILSPGAVTPQFYEHVDYLQWSIDGLEDLITGLGARNAETAGVWVDKSLWISTSSSTGTIELTDVTGYTNHSPDNYVVDIQIPILPAGFLALLMILMLSISLINKKIS